jgi:tripartite-type tricarboxylate transporter receptor subunit TctC
MMKCSVRATVFALAVVVALPFQAQAQSPADFYKGKTIFLQIGSGVGGGYDTVGRLFGRHIGKYIPGKPTVVPQNVPGGGSLQLANQFANITARDGTAFGILNNGVPSTPLLTPSAAKFDPRKFLYLGSPSREAHIFIAWQTAPAKTMEDLFKIETIVGATSPGGAPYDFPFLTNAIIGTKFKIITGYNSSTETKLAMERGEIHANAGLGWVAAKTDYADDLKTGRIKILAAFGMKKNKELLDVPLLPIGKTEEEHQLFQLMYARQDFGRPFMTPPDVPADRLAALREAFVQTMKDQEFLAEANKLNVEIDPVTWQELHELTTKLYSTPEPVVKRMQEILAKAQKK